MADYVATTEDFKAVADAIRNKGGTSAPLSFPDEFASAIQAIPVPKPEQEKELTITENGDYPLTPDVGKVLSKVLAKVNVPTGGGGGKPLSKFGTFTPAVDITVEMNDYGRGYVITHNLGARPKAVVVWESDTGAGNKTIRLLYMIYSSEYSDGTVEFWTGGTNQTSGGVSYPKGFCSIPPAKCNEKDIAVGCYRAGIIFKAGVKYNWRVTA